MPIVDKNGVLTTRHMKPAGAKSNTPIIPPATLAATQAPIEATPEGLSQLIYGDYRDDMATGFMLMSEDDKGTLPLAVKLLTTGSEGTREFVKAGLDKHATSIYEAYSYSDDDELWRDRCSPSFAPFIKHSMVAWWNLSEVLGETGDEYPTEEKADEILDLDLALSTYDSFRDRSPRDGYWRGLAVIYATGLDIRDNENDARVFAGWAGSQPDIRPIIEIAKDRNTLHVLTIKEIMEEQAKTIAPLRQGTL